VQVDGAVWLTKQQVEYLVQGASSGMERCGGGVEDTGTPAASPLHVDLLTPTRSKPAGATRGEEAWMTGCDVAVSQRLHIVDDMAPLLTDGTRLALASWAAAPKA